MAPHALVLMAALQPLRGGRVELNDCRYLSRSKIPISVKDAKALATGACL